MALPFFWIKRFRGSGFRGARVLASIRRLDCLRQAQAPSMPRGARRSLSSTLSYIRPELMSEADRRELVAGWLLVSGR
jgi:hypothetical protein